MAKAKGPAATGSSYPDEYFRNPVNAGIDAQYGEESGHPNDTRTLASPTSTPVGMHVLSLNGKDSYDANWEHGYRGGIEGKKGRK